MLNIFWI